MLLAVSCSTDDTIIENESISLAAKSSSSVELSITSVSADTAHSNYPANNAVDGDTSGSSRWAGNGDDVDFNIDLGSQDLVDYLNIMFRGSGRSYSFVVYTSTDNSSWTKVGTKSSSGTTSFEEFDVTNSTARYIKINFQGSSSNNWNNVVELQVYGTQGEEEEVTETVSTGVDFGDLDVETSWISEDKGDRDTFDASDVDGEEWMDVYNSGIVMMKCLAADGHRTELKEKSGVEASLDTYKKMAYTATLTSIPSHGVTIAQIHNRGGVNRPWIRVYVDADRYIKIKTTETTPDEDSSTYEEYIGPKYTSGDEFTIVVTTENGKASFDIITGGTSYNETLTPTGAWDDFENSFYLKAGVYTEGEDTQPQMKMSSFYINY